MKKLTPEFFDVFRERLLKKLWSENIVPQWLLLYISPQLEEPFNLSVRSIPIGAIEDLRNDVAS